MNKSFTRIGIFIGIALEWSYAWFSQRHLLINIIDDFQSIIIYTKDFNISYLSCYLDTANQEVGKTKYSC